ncbi:hypothetical protein [Nocardia otitidiscaviarum]|uniref:hypothetical protein n=1 Tax=Nocardia otitidiscaviarum TaxID=1823 RepID=UPI0005B9786F|nr:hypothetical protein [Nocardia otitidiscaviarum]
MRNINIERYEHPSITKDWSGLVEGVRNDGTSWILFVNADGSPELFWGSRDIDGGVIGEPTVLT